MNQYLTLRVSCATCHGTLGYKADDGEGVGPIFCAKCVEGERADREEAAKHAAAYRAAVAGHRSQPHLNRRRFWPPWMRSAISYWQSLIEFSAPVIRSSRRFESCKETTATQPRDKYGEGKCPCSGPMTLIAQL